METCKCRGGWPQSIRGSVRGDVGLTINKVSGCSRRSRHRTEKLAGEETLKKFSLKYKIKKQVLFFFFFLGPHLWHMEVPRLGVELELQLQALATAMATPDLRHICDLCRSFLQQCQILNPLSEARDQDCIDRTL